MLFEWFVMSLPFKLTVWFLLHGSLFGAFCARLSAVGGTCVVRPEKRSSPFVFVLILRSPAGMLIPTPHE